MDIHRLEANPARSSETIPHQLARTGEDAGFEALHHRLHLDGPILVDPAARLDVDLLPGAEHRLEHIAVPMDPDDPLPLCAGEGIDEESRPPEEHVGHALHSREAVLDGIRGGKELVLADIDRFARTQ